MQCTRCHRKNESRSLSLPARWWNEGALSRAKAWPASTAPPRNLIVIGFTGAAGGLPIPLTTSCTLQCLVPTQALSSTPLSLPHISSVGKNYNPEAHTTERSCSFQLWQGAIQSQLPRTVLRAIMHFLNTGAPLRSPTCLCGSIRPSRLLSTRKLRVSWASYESFAL